MPTERPNEPSSNGQKPGNTYDRIFSSLDEDDGWPWWRWAALAVLLVAISYAVWYFAGWVIAGIILLVAVVVVWSLMAGQRILGALILFLIVLVAALYFNVGGLYDKALGLVGLHRAVSVTLATSPQTPSPPFVAKATKTASAPDAKKLCKEKQAEELKANLAAMHTKVAALLASHRITAADASTIDAYLDKWPNGDVAPSDGLFRWTRLTLADGHVLPMSYKLVCTCKEQVKIVLPMPPVVRKPAFSVVRNVSGCAEVHGVIPAGKERSVRFTTVRRAAIHNVNCWGFIAAGVVVGSPNDCDWCIWRVDAIAKMEDLYYGSFDFFHTSIAPVPKEVGSDGAAKATEFVIVLPPEAAEEGVAVCIEVDGRIYPAALITPSQWRRGKTVIPANYWEHPQLTER